MKLFLISTLNGLTLASLYFIVASGFSLVFGLMRNVNLAHGTLYLLGAYVGFEFQQATGSWFVVCGCWWWFFVHGHSRPFTPTLLISIS
ncbi:ABC transporter permease subunit [Candidatus Spongiihabitans sp.]|uniref:ABC transporter permease subunit n=1 Tax=Candidatus Spongiihabitans sp. TaxID=3101308 RepID=UPI003C6F0D66